MNAYVMADSKWGISKNGKHLASIPAEQKTKWQDTMGKVIVYGAKHIPELLGQQPVAGSTNIIFTDGAKCNIKESSTVRVFDDLTSLRNALSDYPENDIYVIDNEKLYREFFDDFKQIHVTKIDYCYEADSFFEDLDKHPEFVITRDSDELYCFDIVYSFLLYERRK